MRIYEELVKESIKKAYEVKHKESNMVDMVKAFEVGKTYSTQSICNSECIISVKIVKRTAKTVIIREKGEERRCKIKMYEGKEMIYPWGVYSMCPVIKAVLL